MRFRRCVDAKRAPRFGGHPAHPHVPAGLRRARRQEADEVRHVAAAHEQPAAAGRVADELGNPPHRLRLDLGGRRRERPRAHVRVHRRGEQVAQHANRSRRRRDVPEKARMPVEERVAEQEPRRFFEQRPRVRARLWERPTEAERVAHRGGRLVAVDRAAGNRFESLRDLVHEPMAERPECRRVHLERRAPGEPTVVAWFLCRWAFAHFAFPGLIAAGPLHTVLLRLPVGGDVLPIGNSAACDVPSAR